MSGSRLFEKQCAGCGKVSRVDKRRLHALCIGCTNRRRSTHGLAARGRMHPLYRKLAQMRVRCEQPRATHYAYYGGKGVSVCQEWRDNPAAFVAWAESSGWAPGLEIDRIDPAGDYSPGNCRWVTHRQNSQRAHGRDVTHAARVKQAIARGCSVKEAARVAGVTYMVAWHIKNSGAWSNA